MFSTTSRYAGVADGTYRDANGRQFSYKLLRLIPDAPTLLAHTVVQEDRLDLLAATFYSDPEQFWRICDANLAMRPDDLVQVGFQLRIPLVQR
ncbi:MAG TPA: LysM domain-containing protein [Terriglobales bacterium]|nr:LysM domain-containing protein [Terriglobales bacterium]